MFKVPARWRRLKTKRRRAAFRLVFFTLFVYCCYSIYELFTTKDSSEPIVSLNDTYRQVQLRLAQDLKQEKGMGCRKPDIDPFSEEAMKASLDLPKIICKGIDWVTCNRSECSITEEVAKNMSDISCIYRDIIYVHDHRYFLSGCTKVDGFKKYILNKSDHVKIACTGTILNGNNTLYPRWQGLQVGFRPVKSKPIPADRRDSYNVMILAFDSASHNGFMRKMTKTYKYLVDRGVILNGLNVVGDGTPAALFALLTGKPEEEHPDARKAISNNVYVDETSFIFHLLKQCGYRTAYFEDLPAIGTFQYRFNGFRRQPADHYLRALLTEKAHENRLLSLVHKNNSDFCLGAIPQYQLFLNLTDEFLQFDGKKFCFTFIADISHDNFNLISTADDAVLSFLETLKRKKVFEDTLVIVMGDHGSRYSKYRSTYQGKIEERMPLTAIFLPEKLKQRRPSALKALRQNKAVLTTHFDLHTTLLDVLDLKDYSNKYKVPGSDIPRAMTLLEPIPSNRTCSEAGIMQHWCACAVWVNVTRASPMYARVANVLAGYIDSLTLQQRSKCAKRRLISIESVLHKTLNDRLLKHGYDKYEDSFLGNPKHAAPRAAREYYQAQIILDPGRGVYEGTIIFDTKLNSFKISTKDISRISAYGDEPRCISATHPHLNPFCYCKDGLPKRLWYPKMKKINVTFNKRK
ncbi:uncharacterized protein LOC110375425 [Helicoverpa armigera]|uniref:uncharacterized protein LOC110375425 n=1 Tax=Helicoverpa armigera TaxID=29058 RepID=UPI0030837025